MPQPVVFDLLGQLSGTDQMKMILSEIEHIFLTSLEFGRGSPLHLFNMSYVDRLVAMTLVRVEQDKVFLTAHGRAVIG